MGWNMLHQFAMENKVDAIHDDIYKKGTIVRESTELTGMTPLHKACQYGALRAAEELVKEGADVLFQNDWGSTAMHWTVKGYVHNQKEKAFIKEDYIGIINMLISCSKRLLTIKDFKGNDPLQLAENLKAAELVSLLSKKQEAVMKERERAEEKRIRNKPKVRRI